ncbi:MAG: alkaline phosphatase family protein [Candidatus Hydrogenedentes bacterium]|nr:alkaline phosphatase family protein [Candidatus Hydrogenedentota bacterium]
MPDGRVQRVLVIGLDCAAPRFVFGEDRFDLPNIQALAANGCWGLLRSTDPPITVPAWASMLSSKDPGTLGCYGFRNRRDYSYAELSTADATAIREPRVWDILSQHGLRSVVVGVPQTYPPRPLLGSLVSGFLTPNADAAFTYPKSLKHELTRAVGEFLFDVRDFRTDDKPQLLERIHALMENRFAAAKYLMTGKPWDFFMVVDMGMDRLHHGFWRFCDPRHPRYEPGNAFEHAFRDYYEAVDRRIGELIPLAGEDTAVIIVSDHGAKAMVGGLCINQWLIDEGDLCLKVPPPEPQPLEHRDIDWTRTRAWSTGGYYARIFLNVQGREPSGVVEASEYENYRRNLADRIERIPGPDGSALGNRVLLPESSYRRINGVAPDLLVYCGDLAWRAVGLVGTDRLFTENNDTGPDDANHAMDGIFVMAGGGEPGGKRLRGIGVMDIAPTILHLLGVPVPHDFQGKAVQSG